MCSDGDYDAYGAKGRLGHPYGIGKATEGRASPGMMSTRTPLPFRKRLYRRLVQMFLRWAETDGEKWA